ncbi:MAG TPA: mechanosensitive ion channel family protein [Gammaproteobacteria bacterium]|nr:mechanosensitive ion channel family protein [Gammaproteobacteria bacterium]
MIEKLKEYIPFIYETDTWILQVFAIVFAALVLDFIQKKILRRVKKQLEKTPNLWDDAFIHAVIHPFSVLILAFALSVAMDVSGLKNSFKVFEIGTIVVISWTLIRFISFVEVNIIKQQEIKGIKVDRTTADAISQLLRVSVIITSVLVGLQSLGFNISAILAFGGIGGIAVGFAAKDLLANFFGGLMIYLDRPFSVGDWIRSPDRSIEGTVEKIGWRLTLIRTFDKRPLYIPNSMFSSISVENPSRMTHRRIKETIGIRYDDSKVLPEIITDVKNMLINHPEIDNTQTLMVNFNQFAASSLDFFIYTFTKTTNWIKYHEVKQDVLFKITDIVESHGAEMAFPTSTVHIDNEILVKNQ